MLILRPMRKYQRRGLLILLLLFFPAILFNPISSAVQTSSPLYPYAKVKLENGLTVVVKEVHSAPIAVVDIWVATGAKNELPAEAGISHFFEHMLFKGTAKRKVGEIAKEIKAVGGYQNAATSLDTTHYYVVVPSDNINLALEIQADAIMNSSFDPREIERERKVILEERRLKEDNPQGKLGLMAYQAIFKGTPYANDILGTAETLNQFDRNTFIQYYQKFYHPGNMVVVVVGDVETEQIVSQVRKLFGEYQAGKKIKLPAFAIPQLKKVQRVESEMEVDQTYLYFGFPGPGLIHQDIPALTVLGVVLGGGRSSRYYQEMLEEKQLVSEIGAGYNAYQKIGMFAIYIETQETDTAKIEAEIKSINTKIGEEGIPQDELARAKALVRSELAYSMESNADIASIIGEYQVNRNMEDVDAFISAVHKVTVPDIRRVAKKYLNPNAYVLAIVKPKEVKE